ncbi:MAG: hypothetical protein K2J67_08880, partial [Lachnospiraceae bacterium]|nr:hypothetical protein [Lachnospiraceae bacterium]
MQNKRNYYLGYLLRLSVFAGIGMGIMFTADGVGSDKVDKNGTADHPPVISTAAPTMLCQKCPYANDSMVYICQEDGTIEQWSVDGSYQGQFNMPDSEGAFTAEQLLWVDNEEIIWYTYGQETEDENVYGEDQHVYAAPIEQKDTGEEPNFAETRELFVCSGSDQEIEGIDPEMTWSTGLGTVYADDRYLIYLSGEKILFAYDRISGGQPVEISPSDEYANIPDYAYLPSLVTGDGIVYHTGREPGKIDEGLYGFWCYNLGSKELQNMDDRCFSKAAYVADQARDKVYYQIAEDQSIWEWDCQNGERRELISERQFRRCYDENGLVWDDAYYDDKLFVEEDRLYLMKDQKNPQIFSYLFAESVLRYEEKLTWAVQNSGYSKTQEEDDVYIEMIEGNLLLRYSLEKGEKTEKSSFFSWIRELLFEDMEGEEEESYI